MVVDIQEMKAVDLIEGAAYSSKSCDEKGKDRRSWTARDSCSKNTKCSFEHNFSRTGKGKGQRSRGLAHRGKVSDSSGGQKKKYRHELTWRR